jgi:hypothetical protein
VHVVVSFPSHPFLCGLLRQHKVYGFFKSGSPDLAANNYYRAYTENPVLTVAVPTLPQMWGSCKRYEFSSLLRSISLVSETKPYKNNCNLTQKRCDPHVNDEFKKTNNSWRITCLCGKYGGKVNDDHIRPRYSRWIAWQITM